VLASGRAQGLVRAPGVGELLPPDDVVGSEADDVLVVNWTKRLCDSHLIATTIECLETQS